MKMKSYYAATVEAALKMATQEMGPDALLVNSRRTGAPEGPAAPPQAGQSRGCGVEESIRAISI